MFSHLPVRLTLRHHATTNTNTHTSSNLSCENDTHPLRGDVPGVKVGSQGLRGVVE